MVDKAVHKDREHWRVCVILLDQYSVATSRWLCVKKNGSSNEECKCSCARPACVSLVKPSLGMQDNMWRQFAEEDLIVQLPVLQGMAFWQNSYRRLNIESQWTKQQKSNREPFMGSANAFSGDTNYTMLNYETQNTSSQELTYWASCKLEDSMYLTQSLSLTLSGSSCAPDSNKTLTTSSWPFWLAILSGVAPSCGECIIIPCKRISQAQQILE